MSFSDIPLWEWLWIFFGFVSIVLHCLVIVTILQARRTSSSSFFRGPFFTIVLIQGLHEILEFLTSIFINRLRKYRIIDYALSEDNDIVEWQIYWYIFMKNVLYLGHIEMAANRLSAFLFTQYGSYDKIWNTVTVFLITGASYLIAMALRAVVYSPSVKCLTTTYNGTNILHYDLGPFLMDYDATVDLILSLISATTCFLLYALTAFLASKNSIDSARARKREMTLLKCGIATFVILLPTPIRCSLELWSSLTGHSSIYNVVRQLNMIPVEAMCIFQPWLLLLSCASLRERLKVMITRDTVCKRGGQTMSSTAATVTHS